MAVLGSHARDFKAVFTEANRQLMDVFGMQLVELPKQERVTLRQKRGMWVKTTLSCLSNVCSGGRIRIPTQVDEYLGVTDYPTRSVSDT